jgi:uncharacterized protein with FMN-binding domain
LRKQIDILRETHARKVDRKNAHLKRLRQYVAEADGQYTRALQSHFLNIDTLLELQNSRLENVKFQFESDLASLETEFNNERWFCLIQG